MVEWVELDMDIIVLQDKHGPTFFRTYCAALSHLLKEYYVYMGDDRLIARAEKIIEDKDENAAARLMRFRQNYEYEGFYVDQLLD